MNLFPEEIREELEKYAPLAWRMRPVSFEEFEGQQHLLEKGKPLRKAIEGDRLCSLILYGPPGTGKTALAHLVASRTNSAFTALNAVTAGVSDIRKVVAEAAARKQRDDRRTILFVDEIHRFNKVQQDALLPDVECGRIVLIGASTENPFFALIPALRSRSQIMEFKPLPREALVRIVRRAIEDGDRGVGAVAIRMADDALEHIVSMADGDARKALNALEIGVAATRPVDGIIHFTQAVAEEVLQKRALVYDKDGDAHYDTASALIKSMRGSDPDGAVYYLARMLEGGEDPRFIARRVFICAAEDVGNADPMALLVAEAAMRAAEIIGMPEVRIILSQAVTFVATAPKSNAAYLAVDLALDDVRKGEPLPVPPLLRDTHFSGAKRLGRGIGYKYPHDYPGHFVPQRYLADDRVYYTPSDQGFERKIRERMAAWKKMRNAYEESEKSNGNQ
jgi:putative ATPase